MPINSDIRDQAYQFFIEEAPELLQIIEAGLLTLRQERSTAKIHGIMRAAHSLKGGAASVGLDAIATLAHRLENIFKALYNETIEIDTDLESQLLLAYDCLRLPLMEQIATNFFDAEQALVLAEPILAQIEEWLGDALIQADNYIPSSSDLGVDMALSIFEVDVAQGLEHLARVVANPSDYEVAGELRAQAEVFAGFAELMNQPGFGAISSATLAALNAHPHRALEIAKLALTDFQLGRQAILTVVSGDTSAVNLQLVGPSVALARLAKSTTTHTSDFTAIPARESIGDQPPMFEEEEDTLPLFEEVFGNTFATPETDINGYSTAEAFWVSQSADADGDLEEMFGIASEHRVDSTADYSEADAEATESPVIDVEWLAETRSEIEELEGAVATPETEAPASSALVHVTPTPHALQHHSHALEDADVAETLEAAVESIEQIFESLPPLQDLATPESQSNFAPSTAANSPRASKVTKLDRGQLVPHERMEAGSSSDRTHSSSKDDSRKGEAATPHLSVRVDAERLERINNLVGELAINRNGLSLQNEQLQNSVRELLNRFVRVQKLVGNLRELSDQMLVAPERFSDGKLPRAIAELADLANLRADFDSLELDSYGVLNSRLQGVLEDMVQLEESVDDIVLFARATNQTLEQQRQMLTQLRDEVIWARMLPLGEVLNRFPRMLRDLSTTYHKPVNLKLSGTGVLVDKAALEKLHDPLLHLLRNAFDHGIEPPEIRRQRGKPEQGQIEIRAYHRGSYTIIEVRDDGQGLNLDRIQSQAIKQGLLSLDELATASTTRLYELIFEPGFSTASQVSELSGRGVGLDVVRSEMRAIKGTISVTSSPGVGTTFTLRLPLTLTIAKLLVCFVGSTALAIPSDSIEEIIIPKPNQVKESNPQRLLHWREQLVPTYRLAEVLEYNCPLPDTSPSKALVAVPSPQDWAPPMLVLRQDQNFLALEIDRLVTEQELVIKPFGSAIAPPSCTYGCTILGDGSLIPVLDAIVLLDRLLEGSSATTAITTASKPQGAMAIELSGKPAVNQQPSISKSLPAIKTLQAPTILVVDDAVALRRTLALTLERAGYRVLQARDGREAIEQLQHSSVVNLVICDIEMPNMNGFEFLSSRRQNPQLSKIPIVMLTSRSNDKHRWLAMHLGANAYFTKPYLEQEFVGAIRELLGQSKSKNLPALQPTL